MSDSRLGSQRPTLVHHPPDAVNFDHGDAAVQFAKENGLVLYDWQAWALRHILARRSDGVWAARDCVLDVPRQNGKNAVLEALELYAVFLGDMRLVQHSAHRVDTSAEHFLRMRDLISAAPGLEQDMPNTPNGGFMTANGKESITLDDGARIVFKTRTKSVGRGPSPQLIVFDEAMSLDAVVLGAVTPSLSAQDNPLLVFTSSAPLSDSQVLWSLRKRALSGDGGRLFYAGWNAEPDTDHHDEDVWFRVNPSLGIRKNIEAMRADLMLMPPGEFAREHLGIPDEEPETSLLVTRDSWDAMTDRNSKIKGRFQVGLDVSPDRRWASIAVAGWRQDGLAHFEVVRREEGTQWVIPWLQSREWLGETDGLRISSAGAAAALGLLLDGARIGYELVTPQEVTRATGRFLDTVTAGKARHMGDPALTTALFAAKLVASGEASKWGRIDSTDISSLVAVTLAYGALPEPVKPKLGAFYA